MLKTLDQIRVNDRLLNTAGTLEPFELRSLDAIHLASAGRLGRDLRVLVTYDDRMTAAAVDFGLRVAAPS